MACGNSNIISSRASEEGLVLILIAIILPVLLALVALVAFPSYTRLTRAELQTAVDSAAHAAALTICSSQECYDAARQRAVDVLGRFPIHGRAGGTETFLLNSADGPKWTDPNEYEITILRGAWWADGAPGGSTFPTLPGENRFIMLESEDGTPPASSIAAAAPAYLSANAVYVKITLKNYHDPLSILSSGGVELSADSIAVGGNDHQTVQIAPFAVPACAIVDPNGAYNPSTICDRDFFFARRDRYCPANDQNCNVTPGMFGTVRRDFTGMMAIEQCSWLHAPVASDVFGFVGSPGAPASESDIADAIQAGSVQTHLGDSFHILDTGLTTEGSMMTLTGKMQAKFPTLGDGWLGAMRYPDDASGTGLNFPNWSLIPSNPLDCTVPSNRGWGACNSLVFNLTDFDNWSPAAGLSDSCVGPLMGTIANPTFQNQPYWPKDKNPPAYWPTKAAVVAWNDMAPCQGNGVNSDPVPPPSGAELRVIGYVDLAMYDADIGVPPPAPPTWAYPKPEDYWPDDDFCGPVEYCFYGFDEACWNADAAPPEPNYECESTHTTKHCTPYDECHDETHCDIDPVTGEETTNNCVTEPACTTEFTCEFTDVCCGHQYICEMGNSPWCNPNVSESCANDDSTNRAGDSHTPWGFIPPVAQGDSNFACNLVRGRISCDNSMLPSGIKGAASKARLVK